MKRICTLLVAAAFVASAPSPSDAKNPKGCKHTNVRPANPRGSILIHLRRLRPLLARQRQATQAYR